MATFVLLHGHCLGGWCWTAVQRKLEEAGHRALAPTLAGMGERAGEVDESTGVGTHVAEVVALLEARELADVILVAHSYAGMVAAGAAAASGRIARVVFVDAIVPRHGECLFDHLPAMREPIRAAAGGGRCVPPMDVDALGIEDPVVRAHVAARLTPVPLRTFEEPVHAPGDAVFQRRPHYLLCTRSSIGTLTAARLREDARCTVTELPTGHAPMVSHPELLADALLRAAMDDA